MQRLRLPNSFSFKNNKKKILIIFSIFILCLPLLKAIQQQADQDESIFSKASGCPGSPGNITCQVNEKVQIDAITIYITKVRVVPSDSRLKKGMKYIAIDLLVKNNDVDRDPIFPIGSAKVTDEKGNFYEQVNIFGSDISSIETTLTVHRMIAFEIPKNTKNITLQLEKYTGSRTYVLFPLTIE